MQPLWKVRSGEFAGWRSGDNLFDASGRSVGYFRGDTAYANNGHYIGEIYRDDWIGKRTTVAPSLSGARAAHAGIAAARNADRAGLPIAGWEDPEF